MLDIACKIEPFYLYQHHRACRDTHTQSKSDYQIFTKFVSNWSHIVVLMLTWPHNFIWNICIFVQRKSKLQLVVCTIYTIGMHCSLYSFHFKKISNSHWKLQTQINKFSAAVIIKCVTGKRTRRIWVRAEIWIQRAKNIPHINILEQIPKK